MRTAHQARGYSPGTNFCELHLTLLSPISLILGVPCVYVDVEAMRQTYDVNQPLSLLISFGPLIAPG